MPYKHDSSLTLFFFVLVILLYCVTAPSAFAQTTIPTVENYCAVVDSRIMDSSTAPGEDFYEYACGSWLKHTVLPEGMQSYGYYDLSDQTNEFRLQQLCTGHLTMENEADLVESLNNFSVSAFAAGDSDAMRSRQQELVRSLSEAESMDQLQEAIAELHCEGIDVLFSLYSPFPWETLPGNPLHFRQATPGFISRKNYPVAQHIDEKSEHLLQESAVSLLHMAGYPVDKAEALAMTVLAIDERLAFASMTSAEAWITANTLHLMSADELAELLQGWDWEQYFDKLGLENVERINVGQPEYFKELQQVLETSSLEELKAYSAWYLLQSFAKYTFLPETAAWNHLLTSMSVLSRSTQPDTRFASFVAEREIPEILGQVYLAEWFPADLEKDVNVIIENLRTAFITRLESSSVFRGSARRRAIRKIQALQFVVGGPLCPDYFTSLGFDSDQFLLNILKARSVRRKHLLASIGTNPEPNRWWVDSYSTNAWYSNAQVKITLPAGAVLQLYNPDADRATQYGMLGATIAHEMTHALDSDGRKYGVDGRPVGVWARMKEWRSTKRFQHEAEKLVSFYSKYSVLDSVALDGERMLAENLADLGGVNIALDGLRIHLANDGIEDIPPETLQRFFLAYAQKWREIFTDEALHTRARGWHAPPRYRTNLVLMNCTSFYNAFQIQPGQAMYLPPEKRVVIW